MEICCHGNNKYTTIILLHSAVSITIIHPIIILTFNFDMLELFLYPIYNGATSTISTCNFSQKRLSYCPLALKNLTSSVSDMHEHKLKLILSQFNFIKT